MTKPQPTSRPQYWLVKQEPGDYSWDDFARDGKTSWTGVRNFQARKHLNGMREGDLVLFYHSGEQKAVVGLARVTKPAYPDPTADEGSWTSVDLQPVRPLSSAVELSTIKREPKLKEIALVRQSRLSVMPLEKTEFDHILRLSGTKLS